VAGDCDEGTGGTGAAVGDFDLGTFEVELGNAGWVGVVETELFDTDQVVAVGGCRWNCCGVCYCFGDVLARLLW